MYTKQVLTVDLGASGGRGIVFAFDGKRLRQLSEHRFENGTVNLSGTEYWDFLYLYREIKAAMKAASSSARVSSMGIDTWGLDFGLLDNKGYLLENPVSYRDARTQGVAESLFQEKLDRYDLFQATGTQFLQNNTIFQLASLLSDRKEFLDRAATMLLIPDLVTYALTGERHTEYTIASTTQLMDIRTGQWNQALLDQVGIGKHLFTDIVHPGKQAFPLQKTICRELDIGNIPLVTVASHDSASAVLSIPAKEKTPLYISSGTWSILGTERTSPVVTEEGYRNNFTNEGGYDGNIRFARSLMGMWLIQECMRQWRMQGLRLSYDDAEQAAANETPHLVLIDPEEPTLQQRGHVLDTIGELCRKSHQMIPQTVGEFSRCIFESMAMNYRRAVERLSKTINVDYNTIYIVGGGSKNKLLNQFVADLLNMRVIAGPAEATAYGNAFVQLQWHGEIGSIGEFREILLQSGDCHEYLPSPNRSGWDAAYEHFRTLWPD